MPVIGTVAISNSSASSSSGLQLRATANFKRYFSNEAISPDSMRQSVEYGMSTISASLLCERLRRIRSWEMLFVLMPSFLHQTQNEVKYHDATFALTINCII